MGPLLLYVILSDRIDPFVALTATDGWGGDEVVVYEHDGRTCARGRVAGDTPADADELRTALSAWAASACSAAAPASSARRSAR